MTTTRVSLQNSTNVRYAAASVWLRGLAAVDLDAAAVAAFDLFCRTDRPARMAVPEGGRRFSLDLSRGEAQRRAAGISWGDGPPVLLLHGWNGQGGQLGALVKPLTDAGLRPVMIEVPGHGDASGGHAHLGLFAETVRAVIALFGPLYGTVAHSLGASAAAWVASVGGPRGDEGRSVGRLVLVAPGLSPVPWIRRFERGLGLTPPLREALRARLVAELGVTPEEVELARLPEPTTPTLLVQDGDDAVASWRNLTPLLRAWPSMGVYATRGHGHNDVLAAPEVVSTILDFLREGVATRAPSCGCGEAAAAVWCDRCQLDGFLVERESRAA